MSWSSGHMEAMQMLQAAGLTTPVWLVRSNHDTPQGASPTTADLKAFFDLTAPFSSLWDFPAVTESVKLTQLAELHLEELSAATARCPALHHPLLGDPLRSQRV